MFDNNDYARMVTFNVNYRDDYKSFTINAFDTNGYEYYFTTHALQNVWNRSSNLKTMQDFKKPVRRVIRCISSDKIRNWTKTRPFNSKLIIHDTDINMVYVIAKHHLKYHVITIFNEFWTEFHNADNLQEVWYSIDTGKWRLRDMKAGMVGKRAQLNESTNEELQKEIRRRLREEEAKQQIRIRITEIDNRISRLTQLIECKGFSDEERNGFTEMIKEFETEKATLVEKLVNGGRK